MQIKNFSPLPKLPASKSMYAEPSGKTVTTFGADLVHLMKQSLHRDHASWCILFLLPGSTVGSEWPVLTLSISQGIVSAAEAGGQLPYQRAAVCEGQSCLTKPLYSFTCIGSLS